MAPRLTWQATSKDKVAAFYERFRSDTPRFYNPQTRWRSRPPLRPFHRK